MEFKMSGHLLTGFDIQMKHGPEQTGASAEEEGESKSDRISLRWKELLWHFHSERWGTLKQCWFDVMVGSYCRVEKVGVFTPASLDKLLKRSMERAEELRLERRWVGTVTSHKNKSSAPRCIPLLLSHCSVCFAFNVLVKTEGPLVIASARESKQKNLQEGHNSNTMGSEKLNLGWYL